MSSIQRSRSSLNKISFLNAAFLLLVMTGFWCGGMQGAVFTVTNTNDSGPGLLRQAILDANNSPETPHTIVFNISTDDPGFDGVVFTIRPASSLPALSRGSTTIDGSTQTKFTGDTNPDGPEIVINGSRAGSGDGLTLMRIDNTIKSLVINRFDGAGIALPPPPGGGLSFKIAISVQMQVARLPKPIGMVSKQEEAALLTRL